MKEDKLTGHKGHFFFDGDTLVIDMDNFDKLYYEKGKLKIDLKVKR